MTTKDGLALIASPARLSRELLRRQVKCLTEDGQTHNGPLSLEELGRMSLRDMSALQAGAGKHGRRGRAACRGRHGQTGAKRWAGLKQLDACLLALVRLSGMGLAGCACPCLCPALFLCLKPYNP